MGLKCSYKKNCLLTKIFAKKKNVYTKSRLSLFYFLSRIRNCRWEIVTIQFQVSFIYFHYCTYKDVFYVTFTVYISIRNRTRINRRKTSETIAGGNAKHSLKKLLFFIKFFPLKVKYLIE